MTCLIIILLFLAVPFISFGKETYNEICADAAQLFGLNEDEYRVEFLKNVVNASGRPVDSLFNYDDYNVKTIYTIQVKKTISRALTIGNIFHEFAHAAQHKYNMDFGGYTREQHAEMLAFNTLWKSTYQWNAVHMLTLHSFRAKPSDYLVTKEVWDIALTSKVYASV